MPPSDSLLLDQAQQILMSNRQAGGYTIPCQGLYPFQWNWDSGFIALGYAHFNIEAAVSEIKTLLDAQWSNGFIPHIVFQQPSDTYFPGPDFQRADLSPYAHPKFSSSGITQPPVLGFVLERIFNRVEASTLDSSLLEELALKIFKNIAYFYQNRDPNDEGLAFIFHNWESGTDNSPVWDEVWKTMDVPKYKVQRKDTTHVNPELRPTQREYDHYLYLIDLAKECGYVEEEIFKRSPLLIQDPLFNSMLLASNAALRRIFKSLGKHPEKISYLEEKYQLGKTSMDQKLYAPDQGAYVYFDLRNNKQLPYISSSSYTPLMAGIPSPERALILLKSLQQRFANEHYLCASFDPTHPLFHPKKYWRGPVWINLNWILYQGLKHYGFEDFAQRLKTDTLQLIQEAGFYEYFDPRKKLSPGQKRGYGGQNFSWTAALFIDLLNDHANP